MTAASKLSPRIARMVSGPNFSSYRFASQGSLTDDGSMLPSVGFLAKASNDQRYAITADWLESCFVCFIDPE